MWIKSKSLFYYNLQFFHRPTQVDYALRAQRVERDGRAQGLVELDGGRRMEDDCHFGAQPLAVLRAQAEIRVGHVAVDAHHFSKHFFRFLFVSYAIENLRRRTPPDPVKYTHTHTNNQ